MYWWGIVLVVGVGVLNVAFNVCAREAATLSQSWTDGLLSRHFALAFGIGCVSLLTLYTLYSSGIQLGRAILLMGAVSIIGGTLYGLWSDPKLRLDVSEAAILLLIAGFFLYRAFGKAIS